jgi:uncharacterized membrane protein
MSTTTERQQLHAGTHHLHGPFGADAFGRRAEGFARWFGTPAFLLGQTLIVVAWIAANAVALTASWDPYPFILLNLVFSLQAAYAAPLILLAQTRQADRDKAMSAADAQHREALATAGLDHQEVLQRQNLQTHHLLADLASRLDRLERPGGNPRT